MQQASHKAEPGDYKHAMNDMIVGIKFSNIIEVANALQFLCIAVKLDCYAELAHL